MDAVDGVAQSGDNATRGASYEAPRLQVLGSLHELTQQEIPASGSELGPAYRNV